MPAYPRYALPITTWEAEALARKLGATHQRSGAAYHYFLRPDSAGHLREIAAWVPGCSKTLDRRCAGHVHSGLTMGEVQKL